MKNQEQIKDLLKRKERLSAEMEYANIVLNDSRISSGVKAQYRFVVNVGTVNLKKIEQEIASLSA